MKNTNIFIHIPKTGGTTINCAINKTDWQTKPNFNYRHIDYQTKKSNSADIFNPLKHDLYIAYNIFMLLRHPVDRMISEYSFIKTRPEFINLIKSKPKNFKSYIISSQTQNYMLGFLLGNRMYDTNRVEEEDLQLVINTINNLDIKVGIFEKYNESLNYFSEHTNLKWKKNIDIKRITLNRPLLEEVSSEIKELILKSNSLDFKLYNHCYQLFEEKRNTSIIKGINFRGDKYNYVLKFTERFNLLEIELKNLDFIKLNHTYFKSLNDHLHLNLKIKDGKEYVRTWNKAFLNSFSNSLFNSNINKEFLKNKLSEEPLEKTIQISKIIEREFKSPKTKANVYRKKLVFIPSEVVKIKKKFKWF